MNVQLCTYASDSSAWGGSPHEFLTRITCLNLNHLLQSMRTQNKRFEFTKLVGRLRPWKLKSLGDYPHRIERSLSNTWLCVVMYNYKMCVCMCVYVCMCVCACVCVCVYVWVGGCGCPVGVGA